MYLPSYEKGIKVNSSFMWILPHKLNKISDADISG